MGNSQFYTRERRDEMDASARERQRKLDEMYPPMERPCGTPGAVYTVSVEGRDLGCVAHLPFDIESALPTEAAEEMKQALHDALLPIVEKFYRRVWDQTIAGKCLDGDAEPMPKRWEMLFTKWLRRSIARSEMVKFEGQIIFSEHSIPTECYR